MRKSSSTSRGCGWSTPNQPNHAASSDVLVRRESNERETPEYVLAANEIGRKLSMIEIGQSASEEGGSEFVKNWLNQHMPGMPVFHVLSGNSLQVV